MFKYYFKIRYKKLYIDVEIFIIGILFFNKIYIEFMAEFVKPDFSNINVDRTLPTVSITTILGMLEEPFDQQGVAQKTYNKHFNNPDSEYYQMTVEQIIEKWSAKGAASCHYGSMLDDYIGLNLNHKDIELKLFKLDNNYDNDERLHGLCDSFDNFYSVLSKSGDTIFVDREKTVYYTIEIKNPLNENEILKYNIKGRFDALFFNKRTNKWIVIDWKSSGSIDRTPNKWTKPLLGPMSRYPALNYYTYTTQLYFYKKTLVENYLPEGTSPDDVVVMIVNLPGKIIEDVGRNFATHQAAYIYDSELLNKLFVFGAQKDFINKHLEAEKSKQKVEQIVTEEENNKEVENLEDLF